MSGLRGMRVHFLGTGSGLPTVARFSQTIALEHASGGITLLDVADGASALLLRQGLDHAKVSSILISHMHADHHSGLPQLIKTMMHQRRTEPLEIFMPGEGLEATQAFLRACYLPPEWLGYELRWYPVDERMRLSSGLEVEALPNDHLASARHRASELSRAVPTDWRFQSYSFIFQGAGRRLVYSGNLRRSAAELLPRAQGAEVLILELAHLALEELPGDLARLAPELTLLTHINPRFDLDCGQALAAWLPGSGLPGRVQVAVDGVVVDLDGVLKAGESAPRLE